MTYQQSEIHSRPTVTILALVLFVVIGVLTVLLSPEPAQSTRGESEGQALYQRMLSEVVTQGVARLGVAAGVAWLCLLAWIMASALGAGWTRVIEVAWLLAVGEPIVPPAVGVIAKLQHALWVSVPKLTGAGLAGSLTAFAIQGVGGRWYPQPNTIAQRVLAWTQASFVTPFADFFGRYGKQALLMLALIAVYRISDVVMGIMANPFYVDMGYTKDEVAAVTKIYGVIMTLVGAFVGGVLSLRVGVMRVLMLGAILSAASNLLFAWLGTLGHDVTALIFVISADNLSSGIASAAFIAYLSSLTNVAYSATQYAIFSSMMTLLPKFLAGYSGRYVDAFGYANFFTTTALLGLPVLLLVWLGSRVKTRQEAL